MDPFIPYLNWIDTQKKPLFERVKNFASINTFSSNLTGLTQLLHDLKAAFKILGGESSIISLPAQKILSPEGSFQDQPLGEALHIRKRPHAPIQVLLGGHFDTVYPPSSPFQFFKGDQQDILIGPGVADMKGGLVILLTALEAFERTPFASQIGWEILLTPDEEIGSPGSATLYQEAAYRHQMGLIFEPSFPDGAFVSQRKGSATYSVLVRGKAAHVGRDFMHGRSAVFALARFINKIETHFLDKEITVNVADLEGKGPVNIVPPLSSCHINFRSSSIEALDKTFGQLQNLAQQSRTEGINIEIVQDTFRPPKPFDLKTQKLFEAYGACAENLQLPFSYRATGGVCDGNILAGAGLPTLDTAGAIGGALHTHDEYLILSSLVERSKLAALFLLKLASGEIIFHKEATHEP